MKNIKQYCDNESMEHNEKQIQASKTTKKSEAIETDYSIKSKKMTSKDRGY